MRLGSGLLPGSRPHPIADRAARLPHPGLQKAVLAFRAAAGECPPPARGDEEDVVEPSTYGALLRGIWLGGK